MTTCSKCGRPRYRGDFDMINECALTGEHQCNIAAAAYRRGILAGVELAKERAGILFRSEPDDTCINWTRVEREAAKLAGEG